MIKHINHQRVITIKKFLNWQQNTCNLYNDINDETYFFVDETKSKQLVSEEHPIVVFGVIRRG